MSRPNLGYLFYRECYARGEDKEHIEKTIRKILDANGTDEPVPATHTFELTTHYPGLLLGTGYSHGISAEEDVKIGFYFDHTGGLPAIPGSSVKGKLRDLFGYPMKKGKDPHAEAKHAMIQKLLDKEGLDVEALAAAIFEGILPDGSRLGIYRRDIFYDARVTATRNGLMADDYITPHKEPLKNPIPIRLLKVAPDVTFTFAFSLHDTVLDGIVVTADEKERLFFQLLSDFGIGAKTNVGYGNFGDISIENYEAKKAEINARKNRERIKKEAATSDTLVDKILAEIEITGTPKTMLGKLKEHDLGSLSPEEKSAIEEKLRNKYDPNNKFTKKCVNYLSSE